MLFLFSKLKPALSYHFYTWSGPDESTLDCRFLSDHSWGCAVPTGQGSCPFVTCRPLRICVQTPDALLCVSLSRFRLCLLIEGTAVWHFSDILHLLGETKQWAWLTWEQCPMSRMPELDPLWCRLMEKGNPDCQWTCLAFVDLHLCRVQAQRRREAERPLDKWAAGRWALASRATESSRHHGV